MANLQCGALCRLDSITAATSSFTYTVMNETAAARVSEGYTTDKELKHTAALMFTCST